MTRRDTAALQLARARGKSARVATRFLLGSAAGRVADTSIRSVVEQLAVPALRAHVEDASLLTPAHVATYDLNDCLGPQYRRSKAFDDRYRYRLRDIIVSPLSGLTWLPDGRILTESYGGLFRLMGWGPVEHETLVSPRQRFEGPIVVMPDTGYYHWLLEVLPAVLHGLSAEPEAAVMISDSASRYVEEAIDILSPPGGVIRASRPCRVDFLVLTAIDPYSGFVPAEDIAVLREHFLPLVHHGSERGDSVYVSRRGSTRSPRNEDELESGFAGLGYEVVRTENLPLDEQVDLFRSARFIAGPHGAGLANLVWSDAPQGLVEVLSEDYFNDCFARLAVARGAAYAPFSAPAGAGDTFEADLDVVLAEATAQRAST